MNVNRKSHLWSQGQSRELLSLRKRDTAQLSRKMQTANAVIHLSVSLPRHRPSWLGFGVTSCSRVPNV